MELSAAWGMATTLMREHGLDDWELVFDRAKARAGVCRAATKQIGLSRLLTALHDEAEVRDTVLHEVAHALVGPWHGHDAVWRAKAREIGCSATRCLPEEAPRVAAPWLGRCAAGHEVGRHRRPERVMSCRRCSPSFDTGALLTWTHRGQHVPMTPGYEAELALLTEAAGASGGPRASTAARVAQTQALLGAAHAVLPVGARVRLGGSGRYGGLLGTVEKRGRTRYHVRTCLGLVTAPFALVRPSTCTDVVSGDVQ